MKIGWRVSQLVICRSRSIHNVTSNQCHKSHENTEQNRTNTNFCKHVYSLGMFGWAMRSTPAPRPRTNTNFCKHVYSRGMFGWAMGSTSPSPCTMSVLPAVCYCYRNHDRNLKIRPRISLGSENVGLHCTEQQRWQCMIWLLHFIFFRIYSLLSSTGFILFEWK